MKSRMKWARVLAIVAALAAGGCCSKTADREVLFQTSTIDALLDGVYDGHLSCEALLKEGDFGLGTFHALDGEMIVLDGKMWRVRADGSVSAVEGTETTPFASVTFFDRDVEEALPGGGELGSFADLCEHLDKRLPAANLFHAIRIEGRFSHVKTRSVPRQTEPYPPLAEVAKTQPTFEFRDTEGTIVGFRCPAFVKGVNVTGYHLHYLTRDGTGGGHLLECAISEGRMWADLTPGFRMQLPSEGAFLKSDLKQDREADLKRVEKDTSR